MKVIVDAISTIRSKSESRKNEMNHDDGRIERLDNTKSNHATTNNNNDSFENDLSFSSSLTSSTSERSKSRNLGSDHRLRNSRAQLERLHALYDQEEDESDEQEVACRSFSTTASSFVETESGDEVDDDDADDEEEDLDNSFLEDARASLRDLDEWRHLMDSTDVGCSSSCDASFNSSSLDENEDHIDVTTSDNPMNFDVSSKTANSGRNLTATPSTHFDDANDDALRRIQYGQIPSHPSSTLLWLNQIKDADLEQRRRIAEAIAATTGGSGHRPDVKKSRHKTVLKKSMKRFQNKENFGNNDHGSNSSIDKRPKDGQKLTGGQQRRSVASFLRSGRRRLPASPRRNDKEPKPDLEETRLDDDLEETRLDDNDHARTDGARSSASHDHRPTGGRSSLQSPSRTRENRQPPAIGAVVARVNDKDLQLKRSLLGAARVLTMDGIVESYSSAPENTDDSFDAIVKVVGRHEHINILDTNNPPCELDSERAISSNRLTWV